MNRILFIGSLCVIVLLGFINKTSHIVQSQAASEFIYLPIISSSKGGLVDYGKDWAMVAANPERNSWISEEVRGELKVDWYRPIEPFIHPKMQVIAANDLLYISTATGLYALNAANGDVAWVYPTDLPLGHSPTIANVGGRSVAFVGGFDRRIHAIEATPNLGTLSTDPGTGFRINDRVVWTSEEASAGFETNPLVVNGTVFAGNRDGYFYAYDALTGTEDWKFKTDGSIRQSVAYKDGTLYFASNDGYGYALRANNGSLVWKSEKFPGDGFHTFWAVIYTDKLTGKDYVIFSGGENYRFGEHGPNHYGNLTDTEGDQFFSCWPNCPWGDLIGSISTAPDNSYWAAGSKLINVKKITDYYEDYSYRRTVFILDRATGQEYRFDSDGDGKLEYAPFSWSGATHSGSRYPPIVGQDNVYYQNTTYASAPWIVRGDIVGWKFGTHLVSRVTELAVGHAVDEPIAFSAGGNLVYFAKDHEEAGSFDITMPYGQNGRFWQYYDNGGNDLYGKAPGFDVMYHEGAVYGTYNGVYVGAGGSNLNPLVPYQGRVYLNVSNAIIAFSPSASSATKLPLANKVPANNPPAVVTQTELEQRLEHEVLKMLDAGPLRPGYHASGIVDVYGSGGWPDDDDIGEVLDYFQNPSDTVATLLQALPYLPPAMQTQVRTYLQTNYGPGAAYDFRNIVHVGWNQGAPRESLAIPSDALAILSPGDPSIYPIVAGSTYWDQFPPYSFYAAWKYAEEFGGAKAIFDAMKSKLESPPSDSYLSSHPWTNNQYIAGYLGYLELEALAGYPESSNVRNTYNHLLSVRVNNFSKNNPWGTGQDYGIYQHAYNIAFNFMFLTPELGEYLNQNAQTAVQQAMDEYTYVAPYWFVSKFDSTWNEGTLQQLYDAPALFQAQAYILDEPYADLVNHLDVPAFYRGDLFYIQNLVAALSVANNAATMSLDAHECADATSASYARGNK
ncbi:MAG: PQQ-like beta-propeller repeat protein [Anaerolineae bacterium]|nr:PQQ-like beta-propeller repeat protein [Anaerolineae bacterium]